jgi:hypothetical protein
LGDEPWRTRDNGSHFRFGATLRLDEDLKEVETSWCRWNKEVKRWEFYGDEMPSWDELSEGAKDTLSRTYGLIARDRYKKERGKAIGWGMNPKELPESPGTTLEVLYYLDKAKKHEDHD